MIPRSSAIAFAVSFVFLILAIGFLFYAQRQLANERYERQQQDNASFLTNCRQREREIGQLRAQVGVAADRLHLFFPARVQTIGGNMAVSARKLNNERDVYAISYDDTEVDGDTITAKFANTDDVSVYAGLNDGEFIVSVGKGFKGEDEVTVTGSDGGEDTGQVVFG